MRPDNSGITIIKGRIKRKHLSLAKEIFAISVILLAFAVLAFFFFTIDMWVCEPTAIRKCWGK